MISELNLSGNELTCYAIIFGATQGGQTLFKESRSYLSEWMNVTLPTVDKCLQSLVDKGYLERKSKIENGVKFNSYRAICFDFTTRKESLQGGGKESLGYNNNILINKEKEIDKSISKSDKNLFEECWIAYRRKGKKGKSLPYWNKLSIKEQSFVLPHIKAYIQTRDLQYQQDFERYLRDKTFLSIVYKGNVVIYDPQMFDGKKYSPQGRSIWFNEGTQSYWSDDNFYYETISDGYDDDNRPDGATLTLNNARGDIRWNSTTKKWEKK